MMRKMATPSWGLIMSQETIIYSGHVPSSSSVEEILFFRERKSPPWIIGRAKYQSARGPIFGSRFSALSFYRDTAPSLFREKNWRWMEWGWPGNGTILHACGKMPGFAVPKNTDGALSRSVNFSWSGQTAHQPTFIPRSFLWNPSSLHNFITLSIIIWLLYSRSKETYVVLVTLKGELKCTIFRDSWQSLGK